MAILLKYRGIFMCLVKSYNSVMFNFFDNYLHPLRIKESRRNGDGLTDLFSGSYYSKTELSFLINSFSKLRHPSLSGIPGFRLPKNCTIVLPFAS